MTVVCLVVSHHSFMKYVGSQHDAAIIVFMLWFSCVVLGDSVALAGCWGSLSGYRNTLGPISRLLHGTDDGEKSKHQKYTNLLHIAKNNQDYIKYKSTQQHSTVAENTTWQSIIPARVIVTQIKKVLQIFNLCGKKSIKTQSTDWHML